MKSPGKACLGGGFADRIGVIAGDMFASPLPAGFDLHLFSNVLHDWDEACVKQLLGKSFVALPPSGMIVIHDAHITRPKPVHCPWPPIRRC